MTLDLPSPTSVRNDRRQRLRALLDAELYLPTLVDRLSVGLLSVDTEKSCRWAGWIASLQRDPAWAIIEPVLDINEAWPDAWNRARKAGFSDETEHHQAIFFSRLFERAIEESRFEVARRAWTQALLSWRQLSDGDYLRDEILDPNADLSRAETDEVLAGLFDGPLDIVADLATSGLRLHQWDAPPARRPLRFAMGAFDRAESLFSDDDVASDAPLKAGILDGVEATRERLHRSLTSRLDDNLESLDYDTVERATICAIFDSTISRCRHLNYPPPLDRLVLRRGLDVIWNLRDVGRDDEMAIIPPMVERLEDCAARLESAGGDDLFGLEGAIADLLVFKGEEALSLDDRQNAYEQALETCPGHRNASRLLSYVLLERANRQLLKLAPLPDATARLGAARTRIQPIVDRVAAWIERAEELYPDNDLLEQYQRDLEEEVLRFKLAPDIDHDDQ